MDAIADDGEDNDAQTSSGFRRITFVASDHDAARESLKRLTDQYGNLPPEEADAIVVLGGDGFMLETVHTFMDWRTPIYGMNRGSVGFLMNKFREDTLLDRLARAVPIQLTPLKMTAVDTNGCSHEALAINEVSLLRQTRLAAKLAIKIDGIVRMPEMIADGVLVATPAGSTAYNVSVNGPILPLGSRILAMTPISVFRPRQWRGAILPHTASVEIEVLHSGLRSVSAVADFTEIRNVVRVTISEDNSVTPRLLFDPEHNLEERILNEQFLL